MAAVSLFLRSAYVCSYFCDLDFDLGLNFEDLTSLLVFQQLRITD